jgi:hypothetical protein
VRNVGDDFNHKATKHAHKNWKQTSKESFQTPKEEKIDKQKTQKKKKKKKQQQQQQQQRKILLLHLLARR